MSKKLTTEEFIERVKQIHGNRYEYSKVKYENTNAKVYIICPIHGEFWQNPKDHLNGSGCPSCNQSKLEEKIKRIFEFKKIKYEWRYKKVEWLKNKKSLELDFYLPNYNIAIECQGEQHFKPLGYCGGIKKFEYTLNNDRIKKELCEKNNLPLYYINYNDDVEEKMKEILNNILN